MANDLPAVALVARRLARRGWTSPAFHTPEARPELSWYRRHRLESSAPAVLQGTPAAGTADAADAALEGLDAVREAARDATRDGAPARLHEPGRSNAKRLAAARKRLARALTDPAGGGMAASRIVPPASTGGGRSWRKRSRRGAQQELTGRAVYGGEGRAMRRRANEQE